MAFIKKDTVLRIKHSRKGKIDVKADFAFRTEQYKFWPVSAAEEIIGKNRVWEEGDPISCRASMVESYEIL